MKWTQLWFAMHASEHRRVLHTVQVYAPSKPHTAHQCGAGTRDGPTVHAKYDGSSGAGTR
jgi:hypothetical protein